MARRGIDSITLEVLWSRLVAIAEESAGEIIRTSFSTTIRESRNFALVLLDTKGFLIAQAVSTMPSFIGAIPITARELLKIFKPNEIKEGDLILTNDPWLGTGQLQDLTSLSPIFYKNKLVAFVGITTHVTDVGGKLRSPEVREIYEEGVQIPPCKFFSEGKIDKSLLQIIRQNVRLPNQIEGDILSHRAASQIASNRISEMLEEYKLEHLEVVSSIILQRSENTVRDAIKKIPDGEYRFQTLTDGYSEPLIIRVEVRVRGSSILIDFTGSSPQVDRGLNAVFNFVYAYAAYTIKCLFFPDIPNNDGNFRPISVSAPDGSILNPRYPAAVNGRSMVGHFIPSVIFGALHNAVPELVQAASGSPSWSLNAAGTTLDGKPFAGNYFFHGGQGASAKNDGQSCMSFPSNTSNTPIEILEHMVPLLVEKKSSIRDSGGSGKYRGGNGQQVVVKSLSETPILLTFISERTKHPAYGLFGGKNGRAGKITYNGRPINPKKQLVLAQGDRLIMEIPSGGGYGDPRERSTQLIENDIRNGVLSIEKSRKEYGTSGNLTNSDL